MVATLSASPAKSRTNTAVSGKARPVSVIGSAEMEAWRDAFAASGGGANRASPMLATPRAPNRFRPRRSVSHDAGLIHKGLEQVERELGGF